VTIGGVGILRVETFKYSGLIIQDDGEIYKDISHRIKVGWQKWKNAMRVLCDKKIPLRLKGMIYRMVVELALLYGAKC